MNHADLSFTPSPDRRNVWQGLNFDVIFLDVDGTLVADRQQTFPFDDPHDYETYNVHTMGQSNPMLCRPDPTCWPQ